MLTMYDEDATVFTAMQAGARGYLLKGAEQDEIADAIRAVARGQAIFGPGDRLPGARLLRDPPGAAAPRTTRSPSSPPASGRSSSCSRRAGVPRTSPRPPPLAEDGQQQPDQIFAKLEVADRAEAIIRAREHGLGG